MGLEGDGVGRIWVNLAWAATRQRSLRRRWTATLRPAALLRRARLELWQLFSAHCTGRARRSSAPAGPRRRTPRRSSCTTPGPIVLGCGRSWCLAWCVRGGAMQGRRSCSTAPRPCRAARPTPCARPGSRAGRAGVAGWQARGGRGGDRRALDLAVRQRAWREVGELSRWRWRAGVRERMPGISWTGRRHAGWRLGARVWLWAEFGCP